MRSFAACAAFGVLLFGLLGVGCARGGGREAASPAGAGGSAEERGESLPVVHVAPGHVLLDGARVADNAAPTPRPLDELTAALRGAQKQSSAEQGAVRPVHYRISAADDSSAAEFKSAFQTAAFAGWRRALLGQGPDEVVLHALIPVPGDNPAEEIAWSEETLVFVVRQAEVEVWRIRPARSPESPAGAAAPEGGLGITGASSEDATQIATLGEVKLEGELDSLLSTECQRTACTPALVFADDAAPFALFRRTLAAFAKAPRPTGLRPSAQFRIGPFNPALLTVYRARVGGTTVSGRLPPELIQKAVRDEVEALRGCYLASLERKPELAGLVTVRFVIARDGSVSAAKAESDDLEDAEVIDCVTRVFQGLTFPKPEGGVVTVVYPIRYSPTD